MKYNIQIAKSNISHLSSNIRLIEVKHVIAEFENTIIREKKNCPGRQIIIEDLKSTFFVEKVH